MSVVLTMYYVASNQTVYRISVVCATGGGKYPNNRLPILILDTFLTLLRKSGSRIIISSRPHLRQQLQDALNDTYMLEIFANEHDIRNYIPARLHQKENKNADVEKMSRIGQKCTRSVIP